MYQDLSLLRFAQQLATELFVAVCGKDGYAAGLPVPQKPRESYPYLVDVEQQARLERVEQLRLWRRRNNRQKYTSPSGK